jgi:hypothetical protein
VNAGFDRDADGPKRNGHSPDGAVPWASMFDPAANLRALTDFQQQGMRAAGELVDRFVRGGSGDAPPGPAGSDRRADVFGALDLEPLVRSWWSMFGQFLAGPGGGLPGTAGPAAGAAPRPDVPGLQASGRMELTLPAPGVGIAEIWLHNMGTDDLGAVALRCSDLLADHGGVLSADRVDIRPARVVMPGRSSRGVQVRVEADRQSAPGRYRGTVLADGYPDLWLPVVVTVCAPVP